MTCAGARERGIREEFKDEIHASYRSSCNNRESEATNKRFQPAGSTAYLQSLPHPTS